MTVDPGIVGSPNPAAQRTPQLINKLFRLTPVAATGFDTLKAKQGPLSGPRLIGEAINLLLDKYQKEPLLPARSSKSAKAGGAAPLLANKMFRLTRKTAQDFDVLRAQQGPHSGPRLIEEALNLLFVKYGEPTIGPFLSSVPASLPANKSAKRIKDIVPPPSL